MIKKKTTPGDFASMLGATVVPASKTEKKNEAPLIKLPEDLSAKLKRVIDEKAAMKTAESNFRLAAAPVIEFCQKRMDTDAFANDFHSSYKIQGGDNTAMYITLDKFTPAQDTESIQYMRDVLGEHFDKETKKKTTVMLKPEVFEDQKLQDELVKLIGADFARFFESKITYSLKPGFDERMYKIAGNPAKLNTIKTACNKASGYIK